MSLGARFWRTFAFAMTGVLGAVALAYAANDYRTAGTVLVVGVILAAVSGLSAVGLAMAGYLPTSPFGKALKQFLEMVGTSVVVIPLANLATDSLIGYGKAIIGVLAAALIAALQTFFQNTAEQGAVAPPPAA